LLQDVSVTPDIYGVNDEGMTALKNIAEQLAGFAYSALPGDKAYQFTYRRSLDSKIETIKSD
jgi:hypothetical protein